MLELFDDLIRLVATEMGLDSPFIYPLNLLVLRPGLVKAAVEDAAVPGRDPAVAAACRVAACAEAGHGAGKDGRR